MFTPNVYLLVMASAFFWGSNFVLAGPILADLPPLWDAALRFMLGARVRREEMSSLLRKNAGAYLLLGSVGVTTFNLLFFSALQYTNADNAALIMATNPLLTTLLANVLLGERPSARHLLALPIALTGVAIVVAQGDLTKLSSLHVSRGDLLMLGADLSWALYNVLTRRYMPQGNPVGNTAWVMTVGAVLLLGAAVFSGATLHPLSAKGGAALVVMSVAGTVLAYLFWSIGIQKLGAGRTAIFLNLVPVSAMLVGALAGMPPTMAQLAGGALVLGGVTVSMLPMRRLRTA